MIVISVTGLKGGVGKTSTAVNLATAAGLKGWRTLVWDLDAQGAAAHCLGTSTASTASEPRAVIDDVAKNVSMLLDRSRPTRAPGVSVVAGDASLRLFDRRTKGRRGQRRMRKQIEAAARSVDLLIIDSPPGLGLTLERLIDVSDLILLPTEPAPLAVRALDEIRGFIAAQGPSPRRCSRASYSDTHEERSQGLSSIVPVCSKQPVAARSCWTRWETYLRGCR